MTSIKLERPFSHVITLKKEYYIYEKFKVISNYLITFSKVIVIIYISTGPVIVM